MGLFASIRSGLANYTNFKGTATSAELWKWLFFVIFIALVASVADLILGIGTITYPALAVLFLPTAAVFTRYSTAKGFSPFWGLAPLLVIIVLLFYGSYATKENYEQKREQPEYYPDTSSGNSRGLSRDPLSRGNSSE